MLGDADLVLVVIDGQIFTTDSREPITRGEASRRIKASTKRSRGSTNRKRAKLTPAVVIAARVLYEKDEFELSEIADVAGVSEGAMYAALTGATWAHIPGAVRMRPRQPGPMRIAIKGKTMTLRAWCNEYGVPYRRTKRRIQAGWEPEEALTVPYLGVGGREDRRFARR